MIEKQGDRVIKCPQQIGIGGNFLSEEHTARHMRKEIWRDDGIFDLFNYDEWSKRSESAMERAHRRLNEILKSDYPPKPVLEKSKVRELEKIAKTAVEEASVRQCPS